MWKISLTLNNSLPRALRRSLGLPIQFKGKIGCTILIWFFWVFHSLKQRRVNYRRFASFGASKCANWMALQYSVSLSHFRKNSFYSWHTRTFASFSKLIKKLNLTENTWLYRWSYLTVRNFFNCVTQYQLHILASCPLGSLWPNQQISLWGLCLPLKEVKIPKLNLPMSQ